MKFWHCLIYAVGGICISLSCFCTTDGEFPPKIDISGPDEDVKNASEIFSMFMHASLLESEDVDQAEKVYLAVILRDPEAAYVYYKLARLYWQKGESEKALENFEKAIEKDPQLKEAYVESAWMKRNEGDHAGTIETYRKAVKNIEDNLDLYKMLANSFELENKPEETLKIWLQAAEEHPEEPEPWINAIRMNLTLKRESDADVLYDKALKATDENNKFLVGARTTYLGSGYHEKADEIVLKLLEHRPNSAKFWKQHIVYLLEKVSFEEAKKAYAEAAAKLHYRADFFFDTAKLFEKHKHTDFAVLIYEEGLENRPGNADLLLGLAMLHEKNGRSEQAGEYYEKLLKIKPNEWEYYLKLAKGQEEAGLLDSAIETYRKAKKKFPQSRDLRQRIIRLLLVRGNYNEAEVEFEELVKINPGDPKFKIGLIGLLNINKKYEKALENAKELLDISPSGLLLYEVSKSWAGLEEYDKAAQYFEQAMKNSSDVSENDHMVLALLYRQAGDEKKAESALRKAAELFEKRLAENDKDPVAPLKLSIIYEDLGEFTKAAEYYEKAIANSEEAAGADDYLRISALHLRAGDNDKARNKLKELAKLYDKGPAFEGPDIPFRMGMIYDELGEKKEARKYFQKASAGFEEELKKDDVPVTIYVLYADMLQRIDRFKEAEVHYLTAINKDPENSTALNNLSYMWIERGENLERAIELVTKALDLDPGNSVFLDTLGWGFYQQGKYDEAVAELEKAIEAGATDAVIFDHLGDACEKTGTYDKAIANWEKALDKKPDDPGKIKQKIDRVKKKQADN